MYDLVFFYYMYATDTSLNLVCMFLNQNKVPILDDKVYLNLSYMQQTKMFKVRTAFKAKQPRPLTYFFYYLLNFFFF